MKEIAIHGKKKLVTVCVSMGNPQLMGGPDSLLPLAVDNGDVEMFRRQSIENPAGSIGGIIVEKQDIGPDIQSQNFLAQWPNISTFVVCRNENEKPRPPRRGGGLSDRGGGLFAVIIFLPIILIYTAWVYRVMRGKVSRKTIEDKTQYTTY